MSEARAATNVFGPAVDWADIAHLEPARALLERPPASPPAAGLLDQRGRLDRLEDALDRILDRQHEAGGEHAHLTPGVHERRAVGHVGFGFGIHVCVGQQFARLEGEAVIKALIEEVETLSFDGEPTLRVNNTLHGFDRLPMRLN